MSRQSAAHRGEGRLSNNSPESSEIRWSESLLTGIDVIDQQHHGLVDMINAAAQKLQQQHALSAGEVQVLLGYLKDYAEVHFGTEEALMALCGLSPSYVEAHHRNHARFLARVDAMIEQLDGNALPDGRKIVSFLGDWLLNHIQGEDQGLARKLRNAQHQAGAKTCREHASDSRPIASAHELGLESAIARERDALHASEDEVQALIGEGGTAALVIDLDASLMPGRVLRASEMAARLFETTPGELSNRSCAALFSVNQLQRLPVVMSQVLMCGRFDGALECVAASGETVTTPVRMTHLVLHGRMVMLLIFPDITQLGQPHSNPTAAQDENAVPRDRHPRDGTVLASHPLFQGLTRAELATLEGSARLIRLAKDQVLYHKGDQPEGLYMVVSGKISLSVSNETKGDKVLEIFEPSQIFGDVELFGRCPAIGQTISLTPAVLLCIPAQRISEIQRSNVAFAGAVSTQLARRSARFASDIEALSLHTAMERIVDHLLAHAQSIDEGVVEAMLPASKQVIAAYLNVNPSSLSRAFQQLSDRGLISISGRHVTILDPEGLQQFRLTGVLE